MNVLVAVIALGLVAVVILVVSAPLRARARKEAGAQDGAEAGTSGTAATSSLAPAAARELELAREDKYREIRDAELDYRTGKLSREDYEAVDRALRAEALEILNRLEAAGGAEDRLETAGGAGDEEPTPRVS